MRIILRIITARGWLLDASIGTGTTCTPIHLLTLINTRLLWFLTGAKVCRLGSELLALIELVEMRSVLVNRLRSFLILNGVATDVIGSCNCVTSRVELLDALHQVRILRISG